MKLLDNDKQMQQNEQTQQLFDLLRVNPYDCSKWSWEKWIIHNSSFHVQGCAKCAISIIS